MKKITLISLLTLLTVTVASCADTLTSQPKTTTLTTEQALTQLKGTWLIEYIMDKPVIDRSPARLTFSDNNSISGSASCNNLNSSYELDGQRISIKPAATTRRMCAQALMEQEQRLLTNLVQVYRFEINNDMLFLFSQNNALVYKASKTYSK